MRSRPPGAGLTTRRAFLRRALGLAGAGVVGTGGLGLLSACGVLGSGATPRPDPIEGFIVSTLGLGDRYDAVIKALPDLAELLKPIRDAHREHARALADAVGVSPSPPATSAAPRPAGPDLALSALAKAETAARNEAVDACMSAGPWLAPLLGAIAAARATHLEVIT